MSPALRRSRRRSKDEGRGGFHIGQVPALDHGNGNAVVQITPGLVFVPRPFVFSSLVVPFGIRESSKEGESKGKTENKTSGPGRGGQGGQFKGHSLSGPSLTCRLPTHLSGATLLDCTPPRAPNRARPFTGEGEKEGRGEQSRLAGAVAGSAYSYF